jgi:hypothetical protein
MKIVKTERVEEEAEYYSDFSGKQLLDYVPVTLTIDFGYGSIIDGLILELHLDDEDIKDVLDLLKKKSKQWPEELLK